MEIGEMEGCSYVFDILRILISVSRHHHALFPSQAATNESHNRGPFLLIKLLPANLAPAFIRRIRDISDGLNCDQPTYRDHLTEGEPQK